MENSILLKLFERWGKGDRVHLLCRKDNEEKQILIGSYEDCLAEATRAYDFDKWPENLFLIDITDDLMEEVTNAMLSGSSEMGKA